MKAAPLFFSVLMIWGALSVSVVTPAIADGSANKKTSSAHHKLSEFEVGRYQYCGRDSDCMVVNNGCCDCNNGGQDVAINKENLERFQKRFDCNQVTCGPKHEMHPCGSGVISCIDHKCRYINDQEFEAKGGELKRKKGQ